MSQAPEIQLVYPLAEDMVRVFQQGREQLQDTMQEMQSIANLLDEGALIGRGGTAFTEDLRGSLCPSISKLIDKFDELAQDVQAVIDTMRGEVDPSVAQKYS
jgi:uncharacterized protein YukE